MTNRLRWLDIESGKPPGYFSLFVGQKWLAVNYPDATFEGRKMAWSMPPEAGPWPEDIREISIRLLSLLPGLSASILGDYLFGLWAYQRSDKYLDKARDILNALRAEGRVYSRQGQRMVEWFAQTPVCAKIDAGAPLTAGLRMLHTRFTLGYADATTHSRLNATKEDELKYLHILSSVPEAKRDDAWKQEFDYYTLRKRKWEEGGGVTTGQ